MKNKTYKPYCFRLDDTTVKQLKDLKGDKSWNRFFLLLIKNNKTNIKDQDDGNTI
jgi:hypothetical protein